jgi:hypothetical protein
MEIKSHGAGHFLLADDFDRICVARIRQRSIGPIPFDTAAGALPAVGATERSSGRLIHIGSAKNVPPYGLHVILSAGSACLWSPARTDDHHRESQH